MRDEEQERDIQLAILDRQILDGTGAKVDVRELLQARACGGEHRTRLVDGDDAPNAGSEQFADVTRPASEIADDPPLVEEIEKGEKVGPLPDHFSAHLIPRVMRRREEYLRAAAACRDTLGEHTLQATRVLRGTGRRRHLLADDVPESFCRRLEPALHHRIEATGALAARDDPTFVAQNLEVPTDSRLRKLEHCAQLPDHELSAIEQQKNPAARGIGERADTVEDGDGHEASGARC